MKIRAGLDWKCPALGILWHRCYGYWSFACYPFWVNLEYGEGFEAKQEELM